MDLRKGASVSDANRLRVLDNCYVTTGKTIRKRPGLTVFANLEAGTVGLKSSGGKLNTFYSTGTVTHADTRFVANKIAHPTLPGLKLSKIHYADSFNGYIYVSAEYENGDIRHHYIDDPESLTPWAAFTTMNDGSFIRPTTNDGFRYEVTTTGVSSNVEPVWPASIGGITSDLEASYSSWSAFAAKTLNDAFKPTVSNGFVYKCSVAGMSGETEPTWPATVGETVTENGYTEKDWTAYDTIALNAIRRPIVSNGFLYKVTTAGVTGNAEPTWPVIAGNTVVSGTVTFTCVTYGTAYPPAMETLGAIKKTSYASLYLYEVTRAGPTSETEPTWPTTADAVVTADAATATAWVATTALSSGVIRRPTVANSFLYEVTTGGTTGATQPTWPITDGATVVNGTVTFTCMLPAQYTSRKKAQYTCSNIPAYICRGTEISDVNCPNTASVVKKSSKIFAVKDDVVRFCKTSNPRDWTTPNDAGFLGVGIQQSGATNPTSLGEYSGNLVVFFKDSSQVWTVDPDPSKMTFVQGLDVGCPYPHGAANMAGDVFFASYDGIRSITTQSTTGNMIDVDVGSPIDSVVKPVFLATDDVKSFYFRGGGQFWSVVGNTAYVYSFSRTSKISAWSRYIFPFNIDDFSEKDGDLYLRSGDTVFLLNENAYNDAGNTFQVIIEFPYLDFKTPGVMKMIQGMDTVMVGSADMQIKFDARQPDFITPAIEMVGDTRPGEQTAVEVVSVGIAPVITSSNSDPFELHAITFYFSPLGAIS